MKEHPTVRKQTRVRVARLLEEAAAFYEGEARRFGISNATGRMITFAPDVVNNFLARAEECRQVAQETIPLSDRSSRR